jgi:hypothetical protein
MLNEDEDTVQGTAKQQPTLGLISILTNVTKKTPAAKKDTCCAWIAEEEA